jgi:ABC-type dipeptide/oligopeptide/nickel transport system permease component
MTLAEFFAKLFAAGNPLWYYYPLAIIIGIVYKTTQYDKPRDIAKGVVHFFFSVTAFMVALAVVLYAVTEWL